jgi:hypothetical protein
MYTHDQGLYLLRCRRPALRPMPPARAQADAAGHAQADAAGRAQADSQGMP